MLITALSSLAVALVADTASEERPPPRSRSRRQPRTLLLSEDLPWDPWTGQQAMLLKREGRDGGGLVGLDLSFLQEIEPDEPKNCEIWLHNDPTIEGFFVRDMLMEVFNLSSDEAFGVMIRTHRGDIGLVRIVDCPTAERLVAQAAEYAREFGYPQLHLSINELE